jgi:hypothetical protein
LAVQEANLAYMINYVNIMAGKNLVPIQMKPLYDMCVAIRGALQELGIIDTLKPAPLDYEEYLQV